MGSNSARHKFSFSEPEPHKKPMLLIIEIFFHLVFMVTTEVNFCCCWLKMLYFRFRFHLPAIKYNTEESRMFDIELQAEVISQQFE
jgi:hypothetical protein